jgi:hypothetical protein
MGVARQDFENQKFLRRFQNVKRVSPINEEDFEGFESLVLGA